MEFKKSITLTVNWLLISNALGVREVYRTVFGAWTLIPVPRNLKNAGGLPYKLPLDFGCKAEYMKTNTVPRLALPNVFSLLGLLQG